MHVALSTAFPMGVSTATDHFRKEHTYNQVHADRYFNPHSSRLFALRHTLRTHCEWSLFVLMT